MQSRSVTWKGDAGKVRINGRNYMLEECHWHTPSEHTFDGSRYDMELHLVHKSSQNETAVIGIVYKYGRPDPFLSGLIHHIKKIKGRKEIEAGIVNPAKAVRKYKKGKYYRYIGSLTTPPCTQGVVWTLVKKVRTVSRTQVKTLQDAVYKGFDNNARPIQESNGRPIHLYNPHPLRI
ncbi:Alpha carbonic anhydrase 4 [Linum grandiflorum]